jgi:hypothetical protein
MNALINQRSEGVNMKNLKKLAFDFRRNQVGVRKKMRLGNAFFFLTPTVSQMNEWWL